MHFVSTLVLISTLPCFIDTTDYEEIFGSPDVLFVERKYPTLSELGLDRLTSGFAPPEATVFFPKGFPKEMQEQFLKRFRGDNGALQILPEDGIRSLSEQALQGKMIIKKLPDDVFGGFSEEDSQDDDDDDESEEYEGSNASPIGGLANPFGNFGTERGSPSTQRMQNTLEALSGSPILVDDQDNPSQVEKFIKAELKAAINGNTDLREGDVNPVLKLDLQDARVLARLQATMLEPPQVDHATEPPENFPFKELVVREFAKKYAYPVVPPTMYYKVNKPTRCPMRRCIRRLCRCTNA